MEYEIASDEPVSMAVVRAVSAVTNRDPCSIQPLAEIIDPDALNTLFETSSDEPARIGGRLTFVYEQCHVTIEAGEYLTVGPIESEPTVTTPRSHCEH